MTRIVDNKGETLASVLNREFSEVSEVAIASAYFNIRGYGDIERGLGDKPMRLLLGREPTESVKWEEEILRELEESEDDLDYFLLLQRAIEYFRSDRRQVRIMGGPFFHGKAFIGVHPNTFSVRRGVGVVGSSNFTHGGLVANRELNMVNTDREVVRELAGWFEEQWLNSRDYKEEFLSMLSNYAITRSPLEVVAKALYETYKESLGERRAEIFKGMYPHQQLSYINAVEKLERYGGVLIADSTGLGKTATALNLAHTAMRDGKRVLLVAPKNVLETTWRDEMRRTLGTREFLETLSSEMLSQNPACVEEYAGENGVQLVIVDEAHYFRRQSTNRYQALRELITKNGASVVLITATPVNTSLMDLYSLLALYLPEDCVLDLCGMTLRGYFTSNQARWLKGEPVNMDEVLRRFIVRHSRELARAMDKEGRIRFPERELDKIEYPVGVDLWAVHEVLSRMNFAFYDLSVERFSGDLRMPDGTPLSRAASEEQVENLKDLVKTIVVIGLFKRLESSLTAFRESLLRTRRYVRVAREYAVKMQYFVPPRVKGDVLSILGEDDELEELPDPGDLLSKLRGEDALEKCKLDRRDAEEFASRCLEDERDIDELLKMLPSEDEKYRALEEKVGEMLERVSAGEPGVKNGIIIFTQYADTARYLYEMLRARFGRAMLVTGGGGYGGDGRSCTEAEAVKDFQRHGGILISTDVLSAGQNLQNAQFVVNYDFPWNPVILIQRAGRVDRIGSPYDRIYLVNVLPKRGDPGDRQSLEYFLGLMERLYRRLEMIRETVGIDASTLGEEAAPKDFSLQARIARNDRGVLSLLEKKIEQFTRDPLDVLAKILREKGLEWIERIPTGIGAIKHGKFNGLFVLFTDGKNHYWRLHDHDANSTITSITEITDILMEGEVANSGEKIPYESLIGKLKGAKDALRRELERASLREVTRGEAPEKVTRTIAEIYDALAKAGPEGEKLAAMFRGLANRSTVVEGLKRAKSEGRLLEKAREILPPLASAPPRGESDESIPKLRRMCWCLITKS